MIKTRFSIFNFQFFLRPRAQDRGAILKALLREYWYVVVAVILIFLPTYFFIFYKLPSPATLRSPKTFPVSTQILDRHGTLLYEVYGDKNRQLVSIDTLPEHLLEATVAIEDKNFYRHQGIATEGILRAAWNTLFRKRLQGGSTITQQLVKTALLTPERTLQRKIKEVILALATETIYSKKEILEMYLNVTPYGGIAYGIEAASQLYFDKSARELTLAEAAMLAGLPQAPSRYSPFGTSPENTKARQKEVLRRMQEEGFITQQEQTETEAETLKYATNRIDIRAPHFALFVKDLLVEKYGIQKVEGEGLKVTTSLDLQLQEYAQASLSSEVADLKNLRVGNGAALVTKPSTGEILAMIGSKDYFDLDNDGQVNVTTRARQPGSSIKPINYVGALSKGFHAATLILDIPTCFQSPGQPLYCPKNYDGAFHGPVLMRGALANSYNLPAVKFLALNTVEDMIATASAMGITGWDNPADYGLSLTLGGGEVKMVDMAVAFGVFANGGVRVPLHPILKVEDAQGNILEEYSPDQTKTKVEDLAFEPEIAGCEPSDTTCQSEPLRVVSREASYIISHILQDNDARTPAFGPRSELLIPDQVVSAKTGTTNDLRDNWTIGFTPEFLVAAWVGNNDNTPMSYLTSGVTGAAPIWHDIMANVLEGQTPAWPSKPERVITREVCSLSGLLPNPEQPCSTRPEFFIEGQEPTEPENISKDIWVKTDTQLPAFTTDVKPEEVDTSNLELKRHTVYSDPFIQDFCLSCPWPQELNEDGTPKEGGHTSYPQITVDMTTFYTKPRTTPVAP